MMPTDFYNIDSSLFEEERAVRDTIRSFVDGKVLPIIGDCYVQGRFPKELVPEIAHVWIDGARLDRVGEDRGRRERQVHSWVHRPDGCAWLHEKGPERQAVAASFGYE